jgi:hypothetical protein
MLVPGSAGAINPVSFSSVGDMSIAREYPGGARLQDGRVLIAGGVSNSSNQDTAEIFDPKTNTFTLLDAHMSAQRYGPAVAALPDGRILLAGGADAGNELTSAEVFNPATKSFSPVGSLSAGRDSAVTEPLPDGRVLVAGGHGSGGNNLDSSEIFDPKTNSFSPGPTLPVKAYGVAGAVISGGRILFAGGFGGNPSDYLASAFVFDPSGNTLSGVGPLPGRIYGGAGASLPQGRALVAGGFDESVGDEIKTSSIFDPATNSFSSAGIGLLNHAREEAAAVELADGRVLVAGGYDAGSVGSVASAEVLSVPSNAFKAKLKGRKIIFTVSNEGVASAADSSAKFATTAKKKKPKLVKTTSKHGGPGKIKVKVKLTKAGSAKLAEKGKLTIKAVYTPDGGLAAVKKLKLRG